MQQNLCDIIECRYISFVWKTKFFRSKQILFHVKIKKMQEVTLYFVKTSIFFCINYILKANQLKMSISKLQTVDTLLFFFEEYTRDMFEKTWDYI